MRDIESLELSEIFTLLDTTKKKYISLHLADIVDEEELLRTEEMIDTLLEEVEKRNFRPDREGGALKSATG